MTELPAEPKTGSKDTRSVKVAEPPQFDYVEEFVRYQLSQSLGGARGMIESALPFVAFTIAWVIGRQLYPAIGAAVGTALAMAAIRLVRRLSRLSLPREPAERKTFSCRASFTTVPSP